MYRCLNFIIPCSRRLRKQDTLSCKYKSLTYLLCCLSSQLWKHMLNYKRHIKTIWHSWERGNRCASPCFSVQSASKKSSAGIQGNHTDQTQQLAERPHEKADSARHPENPLTESPIGERHAMCLPLHQNKKQYLTTQPPTDVYSLQMSFIVYLGCGVQLWTASYDLLKGTKWNQIYVYLRIVSVDISTCLTCGVWRHWKHH